MIWDATISSTSLALRQASVADSDVSCQALRIPSPIRILLVWKWYNSSVRRTESWSWEAFDESEVTSCLHSSAWRIKTENVDVLEPGWAISEISIGEKFETVIFSRRDSDNFWALQLWGYSDASELLGIPLGGEGVSFHTFRSLQVSDIVCICPPSWSISKVHWDLWLGFFVRGERTDGESFSARSDECEVESTFVCLIQLPPILAHHNAAFHFPFSRFLTHTHVCGASDCSEKFRGRPRLAVSASNDPVLWRENVESSWKVLNEWLRTGR